MTGDKKIGFWEAFSIGVGGMVGGGIFAVLGLTIALAKGAAPISFAIAGFIALITAYSYVKLSIRYPSEGGTIEFITQAFGNNMFSSIVNTLMLFSYVIMLALYSYAFGSYGSALFTDGENPALQKIFISGVIALFILINLAGAFLTGKAEDLLVLIKVLILMGFIILGFFTAKYQRLSPKYYESTIKIVTGGLIIFLAYEGFELIANTAKDIKKPRRTLPKAFYGSVIFVIILYILVAVVTIANVSFAQAQKAQEYVLAIAAEPFLGHAGFVIIAIAALISTASAINATIYGGGRVSYLIAKYGELPQIFGKQIKAGYEGMIIIGLLATIFATTFNLKNISIAGSVGFLIIFGLVNYANFKLYKQTESNRWISLLGAITCALATIVLIGYNYSKDPSSLISVAVVLISIVLFEYVYNLYKEKKLQPVIDPVLKLREDLLKDFLSLAPTVKEKVSVHAPNAQVYAAISQHPEIDNRPKIYIVDKTLTDKEKEKIKKDLGQDFEVIFTKNKQDIEHVAQKVE